MRIDKYVLESMNRRSVLELIRTNGPIHRAEIARTIDLSVPTIMKLTDVLEQNGLIKTIGKGESNARGGKRPDLLGFVPEHYHIIGVDVGRNTLKAILIDLGGKVYSKVSSKTGDDCSPNTVIPRLISLIDGVIQGSGIYKESIIGMGVGMPGLLDTETGQVIFSPDYHWENVDLLGPLRDRYEMSIILENSNRALAMGEKWFGAGKSSDYFICVNLGHGIGSAIIESGDVYRGSCGSSGEFGHITLEKDGPICDCGNHGCLETLASGNAIARQARELVNKDTSSIIMSLANGKKEAIDAKIVFDAARSGDSLAKSIVDTAIEYIGIGLASYINLLDPDLIILGGGVANAGEILLSGLDNAIRKRQMKHAGRKVKIVVGMQGSDATAIGAASFILKDLIESGGVMQSARREKFA